MARDLGIQRYLTNCRNASAVDPGIFKILPVALYGRIIHKYFYRFLDIFKVQREYSTEETPQHQTAVKIQMLFTGQ